MLASSSTRRVVRLLVGALALFSFVAAEAGSAGGDGREHVAVEKMRVSELRALLTRRGVDCQVDPFVYAMREGAYTCVSFCFIRVPVGISSFTIISFGMLQWVVL